MKRLFAAIKIYPSNDFLRLYYNLKTNLRDDKIKWVDTKNIHITLKFFGETEEDKITLISDRLKKVSENHNKFSLEIKDVGIFGSSYKPKVIWLGIGKNSLLTALASDVLDAMDEIGFKRDRQNFVPHLTIGRIKYLEDKNRFQRVIDKHKQADIQKQEVPGFNLYESILKPEGPEYKIIEKFSFG